MQRKTNLQKILAGVQVHYSETARLYNFTNTSHPLEGSSLLAMLPKGYRINERPLRV